MKFWKLVAVTALLTGCASEPAPKSPPPLASRPAPPPVAEADQCGAREAQAYVGRPRSEIPVPVRPELQRVVCTTCPMTMDFNEHRLNFVYDAETGIIKQVKCG